MLRYVLRNDTPADFPRPAGMPEALHRLLMARGIASAEEAEAFLHPDARSLHDPFLLSDMAPAVDRIRRAMAAGEAICVYGDYDVDGVCASSILVTWLKSRGANARVYLPSRHSEGYGLNEGAVRSIAGWAKLMVTVDCGVTSVELVALAKSLELDVIVTDHHRPAEALPDCLVVNPLLADYPFPYLCGAGVAWKLVWALSGERPDELVDIAALATVADVVSLTGENRAIVRMGLDHINARPRPGIAALIDSAGLSGKPVTATSIAFQLAPRLNAGGRLESAMDPFQLVTSENPAEAAVLAEKLEALNTRRRQEELDILAGAEAQLRDFDFIRHRAIILSGKGWNPGVIGLAASRLVEKYHYPVVMLADQGDKLTGSCRSIEGVDIHAALTGCATHIERYGGHRQAAGLTLLPGKLGDFIDAMDAWLSANVSPSAWIPVREYDAEIDLEAVTPALVAALDGLQPTGMGNPAPVFRVRAEVVEARPVGAEGAHLKLMLSQDNHRADGIAFREGPQAARFPGGSRVDALFVPKLNSYMGRITAQLEVRALSDADAKARIASKLDDEAALQCDFLTEILYNKKIDPAAGADLTAVDAAEVMHWLAEAPQGTLIVTSDLSEAARLLTLAGENAPDLHIGQLPEDHRCFNAVCACPKSGTILPGYRRIVLAGMPAVWLNDLPEGARAHRLEAQPEWVKQLPDLDAMRRVYRALSDIVRRPLRFSGATQLAFVAADAADVDAICALGALLAMLDMGLFRLDEGGTAIGRTQLAKADPEGSAVWRSIQRWRESGA